MVISRSRSTRITLDLVLETALDITDRAGLRFLSIRNLAADLEVAPMTIYGYVTSKTDLLDRMATYTLDKYEVPHIASRDGHDQVVAIMAALRKLMLDHPSLPELLATRRVLSVGLTRSIEATLSHLRESGLKPSECVSAYGSLFAFTLGFVVYELPRKGPQADDVEVARTLRSISKARNFPNVRELADDLSRLAKADDGFEFGLRCLLRGLLEEMLASDGSPRHDQQ